MSRWSLREGSVLPILRSISLQVALVAMMLRALIPAGWMPMASPAGTVFTICTINGPIRVSLDSQGDPAKPKPPADDDRHHMVCHFACAGTAQAAPGLASVSAPSHYEHAQFPCPVMRAAAPGPRYGPHAARAPPLAA